MARTRLLPLVVLVLAASSACARQVEDRPAAPPLNVGPTPTPTTMTPLSRNALAGMLGNQPWTARRAYLVQRNEGTRATSSAFPGREFEIRTSAIYVFDEDIGCNELRYSMRPSEWHRGKHYLEIVFRGDPSWPYGPGMLDSNARVENPSTPSVIVTAYMGGSMNGQGFTGPVRILSAQPGHSVLDMNLSSPNRYGDVFGDLAGALDVVDCVKPPDYAPANRR